MNKKIIISLLLIFCTAKEVNSSVGSHLISFAAGAYLSKAAQNLLIIGIIAKLLYNFDNPRVTHSKEFPKLYNIKKKINEIKNYLIYSLVFDQNLKNDELIEKIEFNFAKCLYPLATAYRDLVTLEKEITEIASNLNIIIKNSNKEKEEAENLLKIFDNKTFDKINTALLTIKKHPEFIDQYEDYSEYKNSDIVF